MTVVELLWKASNTHKYCLFGDVEVRFIECSVHSGTHEDDFNVREVLKYLWSGERK